MSHINIMNNTIPSTYRYRLLRNNHRITNFGDMFDPDKFVTAKKIVILDTYVLTGHQMHYLALFLEWILQQTHQILTEIVFLTQANKMVDITPCSPYTDLPRLANPNDSTLPVYKKIWEVSLARFQLYNPTRRAPAFTTRTDNHLHDRSVTIFGEQDVTRYELSRGLEMFRPIPRQRVPITNLTLQNLTVRRSHVSCFNFHTATLQQARTIFCTLVKHDSVLNHDQIVKTI